MANNSCRFKWTHCNALPIYRAEPSGRQPSASLTHGRRCAYGFVSFRTRRSETSAPIEKGSIRKQCQGYLRLWTPGPHPAPTTSLSTQRIIFEHCGWQVFPIESVRAPFPEPAISLRHKASSGAASRTPDGAGKLVELRFAAEITSQP